MAAREVDAIVLTSMHCVAYYCGFLYCAFRRPYALVVTDKDVVSISAGIDASQPWRRGYGDNVTYTDWRRDNYWWAIRAVAGTGRVIGVEGDHLTLAQRDALEQFFAASLHRGYRAGRYASADAQVPGRVGPDPRRRRHS